MLSGISHPSNSLRYAQGERDGGEIVENFPFMLSVAACGEVEAQFRILNFISSPSQEREKNRSRQLHLRPMFHPHWAHPDTLETLSNAFLVIGQRLYTPREEV